jgi:hypothetical protein
MSAALACEHNSASPPARVALSMHCVAGASLSVDLVYAAISISSGGIGIALQSGTLRKVKRCLTVIL